jgi:hypothetical protein
MDKKFYRFQGQHDRLTERIEQGKSAIPKSFGLCFNCTYFSYYKTKLGTETFGCENNHAINPRISTSDPITFCSAYEEKGKLTLNIMWNIATFIDVEEKNIGFDIGKKEVKSYKMNDEELVNKYE